MSRAPFGFLVRADRGRRCARWRAWRSLEGCVLGAGGRWVPFRDGAGVLVFSSREAAAAALAAARLARLPYGTYRTSVFPLVALAAPAGGGP